MCTHSCVRRRELLQTDADVVLYTFSFSLVIPVTIGGITPGEADASAQAWIFFMCVCEQLLTVTGSVT